ncbi:MAG: methylated-DNA--[protein]-cysteine S-methyltransferase [Candidatus Magasanikbacteria bacterium]|nr:methylated-DNA--[protein]-cysteine S-methyltransferase [Candidatus Magasanikbacteria bacterium]
MTFTEKVLKIVANIPKGSTMTYKQVAIMAGKPGAARAVGNVLKSNTDYEKIPCHRVIKSNGEIGNYNRGAKMKRKLLIKEGVCLVDLK